MRFWFHGCEQANKRLQTDALRAPLKRQPLTRLGGGGQHE